jgi:hypothetical protein
MILFFRVIDAYPLIFKFLLPFTSKSFWKAQEKQIEYTRITVQKRLNSPAAQGRGDLMDSMLRHRGGKGGLTEYELESNANVPVIVGSETRQTCYLARHTGCYGPPRRWEWRPGKPDLS